MPDSTRRVSSWLSIICRVLLFGVVGGYALGYGGGWLIANLLRRPDTALYSALGAYFGTLTLSMAVFYRALARRLALITGEREARDFDDGP